MDETDERERLFDELYERYGRPLEPQHWGKYLAVSRDGRSVMGDDRRLVLREARAQLGRGVFVYKIGPVAVGKWR